MVKRILSVIVIILISTFSLTGCLVQSTTLPDTVLNPTSTTTKIVPPSSANGLVSGFEATLESIYSRVNPSVVNIQVILAPSGLSLGGEALGSGFVWDNRGDIVTNNHVVHGATRITVTFYDGTVVDAKLVGADTDSDLAVINVDPSGLPLQPVAVGDSITLKVG